MYAQDYNNRLYNNAMGLQWDDSGTPYWRYLGETNSNITIRNMRICPARMGKTDFSTTHSYSMPIGTYKKGLAYADADSPVSPFGNIFGYFPSLRFLPEPSSFLLLIEGRANVVRCGGLVLATTLLHTGSGGDTIPAIDRHGGGGVNCLFGDFHVEFVSSQVLTNQDAVSCPAGNPWFMLN
jgi:prepilin-type processing-associated H-X9-DG protein